MLYSLLHAGVPGGVSGKAAAFSMLKLWSVIKSPSSGADGGMYCLNICRSGITFMPAFAGGCCDILEAGNVVAEPKLLKNNISTLSSGVIVAIL